MDGAVPADIWPGVCVSDNFKFFSIFSQFELVDINWLPVVIFALDGAVPAEIWLGDDVNVYMNFYDVHAPKICR